MVRAYGLLFPVCPREYATGAALFRQIRNDTLFFSLSLFLRTIDSGAGSSGSESLEKFHARSGGSVPRPRDVENELIFGFAVGKVKSRYRIEGGGGIMKTICERIERWNIACKNRENLPYYKSINLYLLELFLKRLKFKSWELSLRVQIPLRNSQLCTFIMLIIIIILAMIKYIFLKSTFRNYWNIITCF